MRDLGCFRDAAGPNAPSDIDRERMVILEEIKMYQDQPQDYVHSLFEQAMWPGHALGRDIVGTAESVGAVTRDDLVRYLDEHYRRSRLVVGVSGGIDPDRTAEMIDRGLGLPEGPAEGAYDAAPSGGLAATVVLHQKKTEQAHIVLGSRALSYMDPDRHALDLVNTVLGEGMSSRLFLNIRERLGIAYDVHSFMQKHRDTGYVAVYLGVDPKKSVEAVNAVMLELRRLCDEEVIPEELARAKEFTKGRLRLELETTNGVSFWLTYQELLLGQIKTIDEELQRDVPIAEPSTQ